MKQNKLILFALGLLVTFAACKKVEPIDERPVFVEKKGCTNAQAMNFDPSANTDDGTCTCANAYQPTKNGNFWTLKGENTINLTIPPPLPQIPVPITFTAISSITQVSDTVIGRRAYVVANELLTLDITFLGANTLTNTSFAYRRQNDGRVYRIDLSNPAEELLFMEKDLTVGKFWFDNVAEDNHRYEVIDIGLTVGNFDNVLKIKDSNLSLTLPFPIDVYLYFEKDFGIVQTELDIAAVNIPVPGLGNIPFPGLNLLLDLETPWSVNPPADCN